MKKFSIVIAIIVIITVGLITSQELRKQEQQHNNTAIAIAASFYPIAEFASQVSGQDVDPIIPNGVEPHEYEPTPAELGRIQKSDIFFYNGGEIDPWATDAKTETDKSINMIERLGTPNDPHIWLDPVLAKRQVEVIRDVLVEKDPNNGARYQKNAAEYIRKIEQLDQAYSSKLTTCASRDVIVTHDAFSYLGKRYNLNMLSINGISPEEEPSAQRLKELADLAKAKNITTIFFETLASPKLAETIAREVGATTQVLNPIEGLTNQEIEKKQNYITLMEQNLNNITVALACQN